MRLRTVLLTTLILVVLAAPVVAQMTTIPRYTVVPVVMNESLSSATATVGQRFTLRCAAQNCGGFPPGTNFVGTVTSVTRASGTAPGQIGVSFTEAILPNGNRVTIQGELSSLDPNAVMTDPQTGLLVGRVERRADRNRFIAYGAGAGAIIGTLTGLSVLQGALIGAAAGWIAGAATTRPAVGRDVVVPAGTQVGILLTQPVDLGPAVGAGPGVPAVCPPATPPVGAGPPVTPPPAAPLEITLTTPRPFVSRGVTMVPFRAFMDQVGIPFVYNAPTRTVTFTTDMGRVVHTAGTRTVYLNGQARTLSAPSQIIGGTLYVPAEAIAAATGRTNVTWNAQRGVLILQ